MKLSTGEVREIAKRRYEAAAAAGDRSLIEMAILRRDWERAIEQDLAARAAFCGGSSGTTR